MNGLQARRGKVFEKHIGKKKKINQTCEPWRRDTDVSSRFSKLSNRYRTTRNLSRQLGLMGVGVHHSRQLGLSLALLLLSTSERAFLEAGRCLNRLE
jgi:hypothetical protein